ncbi:MAG TPA: hypothetical protein VH914_03025 [Acidimicrobiia bacterium]|jgi:hypothetical protein|nr:hypothetical protein [Acidimicrobiia bacterium]
MPSAPVKPYLPEGRVRRRLPFDLWIPIAIVVAVAAVAVLASALRTGPYVSSVTFDNPNTYAFEASVSGGSHGATLLLGNISAKNHTTVRSVFDEGSTWTFRFSSQGRSVGAVVMSRADLAAANWHVQLPDRFGDSLTRAGVPQTF